MEPMQYRMIKSIKYEIQDLIQKLQNGENITDYYKYKLLAKMDN